MDSYKNKIILVGNTEGCRPCRNAHEHLEKNGYDYVYIRVEMDTFEPKKKKERDFLNYLLDKDPRAERYGKIPMIWVDEVFIGGYSDFLAREKCFAFDEDF